jgi:hypothetical protein
MPVELKSCPFCGKDAMLCCTGSPRAKGGWYPTCATPNCPGVTVEQDEQGGTHFDYFTKAEAAAAWNTRATLTDELTRLRERMGVLTEALAFYADPETYHACGFMFDRPTGGFDEDHGHEDYDRPMPGKRARQALADQPK